VKENKYLIFFAVILALYVVYEMRKPVEEDWSATFHYRDAIPFGTYVTHDLMKDVFEDPQLNSSFKTIYELVEDDKAEVNLLVLANLLGMDKNDLESLLSHVENNHTVLLAAQNFSTNLADSLGFKVGGGSAVASLDYTAIVNELAGEGKTKVRFTNSDGAQMEFSFPSLVTSSYFSEVKSDSLTELAWREDGEPVLIKYNVGKGDLYLSTMPLAFTNYFVLLAPTSAFASSLLSLFPKEESLQHIEYYQLGSQASQSEFRVILQNDALRWALYILIITLLIFLLFESKRRQRIIPIVTPLKNTTLEFAQILGQLHHKQEDHKNLAKKIILFWKDYVRSKYMLRTDKLDNIFVLELQKKSGTKLESIEALVQIIEKVEADLSLKEGELMLIEKLMNEFYGIV